MAAATLHPVESAHDKPRTSETLTTLEKYGYIVGDIIGRGAFATVKKAYWQKMGVTVAVKIVSIAQLGDTLVENGKLREVEAMQKLRHENIIRCYEYFQTNMRYYITMRYAENGSLLNLLKKEGHLKEPRARRYYHELINALQYIHTHGYAHRDIKLENLMLDANDRLKLIDFGFACRLWEDASESSSQGEPHLSETFCGSHAYASPEVLKFKPYDPVPSDIWASGVVLFSLLFGELPFSNKRNVRVMLEIIAKGVHFPSTVRVSEEVKLLLKQIFVPVSQRITGALIQRSLWFFIELIGDESSRRAKVMHGTEMKDHTQTKRQKLNRD
ncbi:testis-specific serine/threonine-protein kinase 4-like [Anopheles maculipalpis]|uniref:testis-specific serine/threonine-protein kinase 4-like n=1 Tax=Anopheles maculipalpis TaxID=1496333 RepID=UPI002159B2A1|nr:testis-specific serine/threonine-protein kinase 4-like [Anopheles maculipalpis]